MKDKVVVIGGGPAGMLAAGTARSRGRQVLILERNRVLGRKLLLTGKGRCNITNYTDIDNHVANLFPQGRFLYSALFSFSPEELIYWLEERGVSTKIERGARVFPASDDSHDVRNCLLNYLKENGVELKPLCRVLGIRCRGPGRGFHIKTDTKEIPADRVILATGGCSYPQTGSSGDGLVWARQLGHRVMEPEPGLVPLITREQDLDPARGLILKNVGLTVQDRNKGRVFSEQGELEIRRDGLGGPLALAASLFIQQGREYSLAIDLKPAVDRQKLDRRLQREIENLGKEKLIKLWEKLLPLQLIGPVEKRTELNPEQPIQQLTREQRQVIVESLKNFSLTVKGKKDWSEAIITMGGVDCSEIDPATMESRVVPGLFLAGEIINLHGYTGGYNLQAAFSTGFAAGSNC